MDSYLDTSFLLKFYLLEPDSGDAITWLRRNLGRVTVSPFSDLEVITVFGRGMADSARRNIAHDKQDCEAGVFKRIEMDSAVFAEAERLIEAHAGRWPLRSLDTLHLATAIRHAIPQFGTYDKQLARVASSLGLTVLP